MLWLAPIVSSVVLCASAPLRVVPGIDVTNVDKAWDDHVEAFGVHARDEADSDGNPLVLTATNPAASDEDLQSYRKAIFAERFDRFVEHNTKFSAGEVSYRQVINKFADLSLDELKEYIGQRGMVGRPSDAQIPEGAEVVVPKSSGDEDDLDWRTDDLPLHNQGNCGSCWAFASAAMIESRLYHQGYGYIPVAEQEMVDCVDDCYGCSGGWSFYATEYVEQNGIASGNSYPYMAYDQQCAADTYDRAIEPGTFETQYAKAKGEEYMPAILADGPMTIAFWVIEDFYYLNGEDVYTPSSKCNLWKSLGGHAVTVVGMQSDHWIVQNSWGTDWGDDGFFRIVRGENACKIGTVDNWSWISFTNSETFPEVDTLIQEGLEREGLLGSDGEATGDEEPEKQSEEDDTTLSPGVITLIVAGSCVLLFAMVIPACMWWATKVRSNNNAERNHTELLKSYGGCSPSASKNEDPPAKQGLDFYKEPPTSLEMKRTKLDV